jgi:NAD(P)-dependent dehydrogenase (short-subunit alcohol dehydrogenase family)
VVAGGALALVGARLAWRLVRHLRSEKLAGQVVLITGASRGLGLLLARRFAAAGCRLVICARDERELDRARRDLELRGAEVLARRCDVSDRDQATALVAAAIERFGALDVLVNNAGIVQVGPVESLILEDFGRALGVNFWGPLYLVAAALPHMRVRGHGRIVNVTSIGGPVAVPHLLPYDCAKAALLSLSEGLGAELAKDGITVTTVVPGLMRTGSPVNALFKGDAEREFEWFSIGDSLPLVTISAERAARRIVSAVRHGDLEVVLSLQSRLLRVVHALAPALMVRLLGLVNRLLPSDNRGERYHAARGMELATPRAPSALTRTMNHAARHLNQYGGSAKPSPAHLRGLVR